MASNLTPNRGRSLRIGKDRHEYEYEYENHITKIIRSGPTTVAKVAYHALCGRVKKVDCVAGGNAYLLLRR